jgi:hypothetical protein
MQTRRALRKSGRARAFGAGRLEADKHCLISVAGDFNAEDHEVPLRINRARHFISFSPSVQTCHLRRRGEDSIEVPIEEFRHARTIEMVSIEVVARLVHCSRKVMERDLLLREQI